MSVDLILHTVKLGPQWRTEGSERMAAGVAVCGSPRHIREQQARITIHRVCDHCVAGCIAGGEDEASNCLQCLALAFQVVCGGIRSCQNIS